MIERNIHIRCTLRAISRVSLCPPTFSAVVKKWCVNMKTWRGEPGNEHMVYSVTSGALFDTEAEAAAAGDRAMDTLQSTGKYPNMCEQF